MTPIILLAGGASSRMGMPKGLVPVNGKPWLTLQLERLNNASLSPIVLVLGHQKELYLEAAPWKDFDIQLSENPRPELGPFSSLQVGLKNLPPDRSSFLLPVDVPAPEPSVFTSLLERASESHPLAAIPTYQGRRGHPVWLAGALLNDLRLRDAQRRESRLDFILRSLPSEQVLTVPVQDPRVIMNLNTPQDFTKMASPSAE